MYWLAGSVAACSAAAVRDRHVRGSGREAFPWRAGVGRQRVAVPSVALQPPSAFPRLPQRRFQHLAASARRETVERTFARAEGEVRKPSTLLRILQVRSSTNECVGQGCSAGASSAEEARAGSPLIAAGRERVDSERESPRHHSSASPAVQRSSLSRGVKLQSSQRFIEDKGFEEEARCATFGQRRSGPIDVTLAFSTQNASVPGL